MPGPEFINVLAEVRTTNFSGCYYVSGDSRLVSNEKGYHDTNGENNVDHAFEAVSRIMANCHGKATVTPTFAGASTQKGGGNVIRSKWKHKWTIQCDIRNPEFQSEWTEEDEECAKWDTIG